MSRADAAETRAPLSVRDANRRFYDQIAEVYDDVDPRRGDQDAAWIDRVLAGLAAERRPRVQRTLRFLDAGTGSGFLARHAQKYFGGLVMLDLSAAMLRRAGRSQRGAHCIQGDCDRLPFAAATLDVVGAFATLHHVYDPSIFLGEAFRVLAPGGILYTDHDIEATFVRRFRLPLRLYRSLFDHGDEFLERCPEASRADYELSEYHGDRGLLAERLVGAAERAGFQSAVVHCHWEGMGGASKLLGRMGMSERLARKGWAPVVRLIARKAE